MTEKLIPPDFKHCQCEITYYNAWSLGGGVHRTRVCNKTPHWFLKETKPGPDGQIGSMCVCDECAKKLPEKLKDADGYTMDWITDELVEANL